MLQRYNAVSQSLREKIVERLIVVIMSYNHKRLIIGNDHQYHLYLLYRSRLSAARLQNALEELKGTDFQENFEQQDELRSKIERIENHFGIERYDHT